MLEADRVLDDLCATHAKEAWSRLASRDQSDLARIGVPQLAWVAAFGFHLARKIRNESDPQTPGDAIRAVGAWSDSKIADFAHFYTTLIVENPDSDPMLMAGAIGALRETLSSRARPSLQVARTPPAPAPTDDSTPLDGLVSLIRSPWQDDGIYVGRFRLAGGLEIAGAVVLSVLLWIPVTLQNSYRLATRGFNPRRAAIAAGGWAGVAAVLILISQAGVQQTTTTGLGLAALIGALLFGLIVLTAVFELVDYVLGQGRWKR